MFANVNFKPFLQPYLGEIKEQLIFIPNISYPTDQELGLRLGSDLVCIVPPRLAWGDSPPWPYDEDPAHIYRSALAQFGRMLMVALPAPNIRSHRRNRADTAARQRPVQGALSHLGGAVRNLFVAGAVAIYLEDHVSMAEANAYVLMERKVHGLEVLPGVISVFRRYMKEVERGRYKTLLDLLPQFARQLRVANRIVSLRFPPHPGRGASCPLPRSRFASGERGKNKSMGSKIPTLNAPKLTIRGRPDGRQRAVLRQWRSAAARRFCTRRFARRGSAARSGSRRLTRAC